jgi:LAO/AO transport system kinase
LSETATDLVAVLSLFEFRRVIVETVGAGQSDIEIHETADCTVVMTVPGLGDGVQASKAGLMEIGDIFVVNKADMPGAEAAGRTVENALAAAYMGEPGINNSAPHPAAASRPSNITPGLAALRRRHGDISADTSAWVPPVIQVVATENGRVADLAATVDLFVEWSERTGRRAERSRERAYAQIMRALTARLLAPYLRAPEADQWPAAVSAWVDRISEGKASPVEAARALANRPEK